MQWLARETGTTSPHGRPMKDRGALCFTPVALVSKVAIPNAIARREAIARPFGRSQSRQDSKFRFGSNGPHGFGRLTTGKGGGQQRVPGGNVREDEKHTSVHGRWGRLRRDITFPQRVLSHVTRRQSTARMGGRCRNRAGCAPSATERADGMRWRGRALGTQRVRCFYGLL